MPSVLVEAGFLTNPQEERYLMSSEGQEYIASAIYRAFKSYKTTIEEKSLFVTKVNNELKNQIINDSVNTNKIQNIIFKSTNSIINSILCQTF